MTFDLVAASLTYTLTSPATALSPGDQFSFSYRIFNGGTEPASGSASAVVMLSSDLAYSADDVILFTYTYTYPTFPGFFGHNVTVLLPTSLIPGSYNLIFQIDTQNQIAESNEINNTRFEPNLILNRADLTTNTAIGLFDEYGKLAFMAKLAAAAYQLTEGEPIVDGINHYNPDIYPYFRTISSELTLLDGTDIPALSRSDLQGIDFPVSGLRNGIYTNQNAAALIARSSDAVFLAFRGTNDNNGEYGFPKSPSPETPDGDHWVGKGAHFALFAEMLTAVAAYMKTFGLTTLYVTGHSLGAAMVQAFMETSSSITVIGDTFASPGYDVRFDPNPVPDMDNLWIAGDPILKAARLAANFGDGNTIYHNLDDQIKALDLRKINFFGFEVQQSNKEKLALLHSVTYYADFAAAMQQEGIGEDALSGRALHNIDYDRVFLNATVKGNGRWIEVESLNDTITGFSSDDIILGVGGRDSLSGGGGRDHMVGGVGADTIKGETQSDYLYGGDGSDWLFGGSNRDTLTGGAGADQFVFLHIEYFGQPSRGELPAILPVPYSLNDTIEDFETGIDKIRLENIYTRFAAGDRAFDYLARKAFTSHAGEIRFSYNAAGNTLVQGDIDGNGVADFTITLLGLKDLQATDFVL